MRSMRGTGARSVAVAAVAALALTACGTDSDDNEPDAETGVSESADEPDEQDQQDQQDQQGEEPDPAAQDTDEDDGTDDAQEAEGADEAEGNAAEDVPSGDSALTAISVEAGEEVDTVTLEFEDAAPEYANDRFVNPVHRGGDYADETHDIEGDWFLQFDVRGQGLGNVEVDDVTADGRVLEVRRLMQFEGVVTLVIAIDVPYGEQPGYEFDSDGNTMTIEIAD